jgi:hypothetical protein
VHYNLDPAYNIWLENYSLLFIFGTQAGILRQQKRRFMGLLMLIPTDITTGTPTGPISNQ